MNVIIRETLPFIKTDTCHTLIKKLSKYYCHLILVPRLRRSNDHSALYRQKKQVYNQFLSQTFLQLDIF